MNNEELKNKIAKFICNACEMGSGFDGECDIGNDYQKCSICGETADALIAAGIGDVKSTQRALLIAAREIMKERGYVDSEIEYLAKEVYIPEVMKQAEKELAEERK